MREKRLIAVVGAGVVAVVAILVVVIVGVQPAPEFADLAGSDLTGYVAFAPDEGEAQSVRIVDLSTARSVEANIPQGAETAGWDEDGNLVVVQWGPNVTVRHLDPTTGEQVSTTKDAEEYLGPGGQGDVWIDHSDGLVVLERGDGATASFEAPESYDVTSASAMGEDHVVFVDEMGRVAVCEVGEDVIPVQVAEDAMPWWWVTARS